MNDVYVYLIDMPCKAREVVTPCLDGGYTVYINSRLSYQDRVKAYCHALRHIENNDFESEEDIQTIEARAHRGVKK